MLRVIRDVDIASVGHLDEAIAALAAEPVVVIDLDACPYFDSTGLTVLLRRLKTQAMVIVLPASSGIHRTFEVTGLLNIFRVVETVADAQQAADEIVTLQLAHAALNR